MRQMLLLIMLKNMAIWSEDNVKQMNLLKLKSYLNNSMLLIKLNLFQMDINYILYY